MEKIEGNIIDIHHRKIYPGTIFVSNGKIQKIEENGNNYSTYLAPGFIDAHVHIESSMLTPIHFSDLVISKGTVAVINDPHEIANVLGMGGIQFMLQNSRDAGIKYFFGIPSCVPATSYDFAGGVITSKDVEELAATGNFVCLSEVMDIPGVLNENPEIIKKIQVAKKYELRIDGHAPFLTGDNLRRYISTGISTDHESSNLKEAIEKLELGMKVIIRDGSAAKNYEALKSLIEINPDLLMFCTDDAHPDDLIRYGHIDKIVRKAIADGYDLFTVWRIASLNPVIHYNLPVGVLREGDFADFIRIANLESLEVLETYLGGRKLYEKEVVSSSVCHKKQYHPVNRFGQEKIHTNDLRKRVVKGKNVCIEVINQQIVTLKSYFESVTDDIFCSDVKQDILKIVYLNRYLNNKKPQVAWIKGIGMKEGAFATSIAHDSHNILAIGCKDEEITEVINRIIEGKGGLAVINSSGLFGMELPIGGIMSDKDAFWVASKYGDLLEKLRTTGCKLDSPFMTLSFMSLLVIPEIKIGELGLFDFRSFEFIENKES
ncbi:adenine deaminase [Odoribacter lunatus]|uniref:adenine deaminase n=1 Tax=Odoribacter lunatus TaxID=2941335 RepID=UPI002041E15A|nr:adenine deaminase [Odoribacter lunatus]